MPKNKDKLTKAVNTSLKPIEKGWNSASKALIVSKKKVPAVFNRINSVIRQQFISLEVGKKLRGNLNIGKLGQIVTAWLLNNLPYIDKDTLRNFGNKNSAIFFLDNLTRGVAIQEEHKEYTCVPKGKMFKSVLIANRGEIALRIIRACKELGVKTIQVYTKQDAKSLAVKFADKKVYLGEDAGLYLNMEKIIKIATKHKAHAIHPGYGFLAENADFCKMCKRNKIKFIGPSYEAIKAMGDKINAKNMLKNSGVPVLEGTDKPVQDIETGQTIAKEIGFPIIIKAAAGGGGKGMRVVREQKKFEESFTACQTEAETSFKNKEVFIEKYIEAPRHIEFQVLGDSNGSVIHLGERDCSIQRRHQKLIEEAPSSVLTSEMRKEMGQAAVKVASVIKYEGAGTVEFLLDKNNNFYFMEMNTRIQVEHGITEMITGIDLVKEQIKVASGARLVVKQEDVQINGWAIECRINAECPLEGFCPTTGTISNYLPPGGPGIRVCSSSHQGQEVSPHYDSMLAKLMCSGKTRQEAIDRTKRALNEFIIEGVDTTVDFHRVLLDNKNFQKGNITTDFIEKNKIMELLKQDFKKRKKILTKEEKAIIITTAVSKYLKKKNRFNDKGSNWVRTGRLEAVTYE